MNKYRLKLERALWASCMGNMGMAASWLKQAESSVAQSQSENDFVAHSHPSNRRKASAAHRLASYLVAPESIAELA